MTESKTYLVETLAISGHWVPNNGEYRLLTFFEAAVESYAARLQGMRTRIVKDTGDVVVESPPLGTGGYPRRFHDDNLTRAQA